METGKNDTEGAAIAGEEEAVTQVIRSGLRCLMGLIGRKIKFVKTLNQFMSTGCLFGKKDIATSGKSYDFFRRLTHGIAGVG